MKLTPLFFFITVALTATVARAGDPTADELTPGEVAVRKHFPADSMRCTTIRLWPDKVPDEPRAFPAEAVGQGTRSSNIKDVSLPSITVVRPNEVAKARPAVLVCPGGGYGSLGIDVGGVDVIQWLNQLGITGIYMKYRVPKRGRDFPMSHQPLQDIQRAVILVRSRAAELQVDAQHIGVIGFSAGGNLAAMLATHHTRDDRLYPPIDAADQLSCRPDFVVLVAPAYLTKPIVSSELDPGLNLDKTDRKLTPPIFITAATTDKFAVGASHFALALREKKVSVEVHLYEKGGHAEGISDRTDNQWPTMAEDWLKRKGVIGEASQKR